MKHIIIKSIVIMGLLVCLFSVNVSQARAVSLEDVRTAWQSQIILPLLRLLRLQPAPSPTPSPLLWSNLEDKQKTAQLENAKRREVQQIQQATKMLRQIGKQKQVKTHTEEIIQYLESQQETIRRATSPAELEVTTEQLQKQWNKDKAFLKDRAKL